MIHSQFRSSFVQTRQGKMAVALVLTLLLLLPLQLLAQNSVPQQNAGSLSFLVISDWGGKGGTTQVAVAQQMGRAAAAQKSSFVITCGDNYHGSGISSADSPRWKTEYEDIYSSPSLMIPWYVTLGNHDNRGKVDAEIAYSKISSRWKLPARYYTHTEKIDGANEALFVHLDTSPLWLPITRRDRPTACRARIPSFNCVGLNPSWRGHGRAGRSSWGIIRSMPQPRAMATLRN